MLKLAYRWRHRPLAVGAKSAGRGEHQTSASIVLVVFVAYGVDSSFPSISPPGDFVFLPFRNKEKPQAVACVFLSGRLALLLLAHDLPDDHLEDTKRIQGVFDVAKVPTLCDLHVKSHYTPAQLQFKRHVSSRMRIDVLNRLREWRTSAPYRSNSTAACSASIAKISGPSSRLPDPERDGSIFTNQ